MKLRITPVVDGYTMADIYVDHPNFSGAAFSMTVYAESSPAVIDKYTQAAGAITKAAGTDASKSPNDSRNPANYTP
jgi:hypothetical protein